MGIDRGNKKLQQTVRLTVKKLLVEPQDLQSVAETALRFITARHQAPHRQQVMEDLLSLFLACREQLCQQPFPCQSHLLQLSHKFQELAGTYGIEPGEFYPALLERLLAEMEAVEMPSSAPKTTTKEKILEAALEVFSEKGFYVATVDEIAERAAVGKGTLYRHFANKEALFNELAALRLKDLEQRVQTVLDGDDDVLTMITKYLRVYFEFFDHNQRLYRVMVQERMDFGDQVKDLYISKIMRRIPILKRKIYEASLQGILKEGDFETLFYGVMGFIHGVIQKWLAHDCSYSLLEELPTVVETLFYGLVRRPHSAAS